MVKPRVILQPQLVSLREQVPHITSNDWMALALKEDKGSAAQSDAKKTMNNKKNMTKEKKKKLADVQCDELNRVEGPPRAGFVLSALAARLTHDVSARRGQHGRVARIDEQRDDGAAIHLRRQLVHPL